MTGETTVPGLDVLGYDDHFDAALKTSGFPGASAARVISEHRESYEVKDALGEYGAKITGKWRHTALNRADYPAVGDWVAITKPDGGGAIIHQVLPRKTILQKKYSDRQDTQLIAANVDVAFIVESMDRDYSLNRFERYLVLALEGGIRPVILLNKIDLLPTDELDEKLRRIGERFGDIALVATSAVQGRGLDGVAGFIKRGTTCCFFGSSGTGKSSLINRLLDNEIVRTGELSGSTGRGRHTTTARAMYFLDNGGIVIDNPGTREVGIADAAAGIEAVFDDLFALAADCRYADCTHVHEPGCAVRKAVEDGKLGEHGEARYRHFLQLKKENDFYAMTAVEKRTKDRNFGKFIKRAKKQLKEFDQ